MANYSSADGVFHALADPTRRAIVSQLCRAPATVSNLAAPHTMALPTFLQHLRVLEQCGLVSSHKRGRTRTCTFVPGPMREAETWLAKQRAVWERRLDQLDQFLVETHNTKPNLKSKGKT